MSVPLWRNIGLYETLAGLPEGLTGEILDGQPRPTGRHAHAESVLGMRAGTAVSVWRGRTGRLVDPDRVRGPLRPGYRGGATGPRVLAARSSIPEDQRFLVAPDWVCEILSPGSRSKDREIKMPLYARQGVRHAWLVDPRERTLKAYALRDAHWAPLGCYRGDRSACVDPFDAVRTRGRTAR